MISAQLSSVQSLSRVRLFATPWTAACQASLSITNSRSSLRLTSVESVMPFSHLILCHPLLLLPAILPSIRVFSNESTLHMRWPKYWSFSFSIISSKEIPGLISFRMDWLDLLVVQGTLKSLLHHHSSKASILRCSAGSLFTIYFKYLRHRYTKKEKKKSIYLKLQWTESCILFAKADKTLLVPLPGAEFRFWIPHSPLTGVVLKQTFLDLLIHEIEPLRHWPWSPLNLLQLFFKPAEPQMQRGHQHILD